VLDEKADPETLTNLRIGLFLLGDLIVVFTAVCMALGTVAAIIPALFLVLVIHFILFVAVGTGPAGGVATRMACLTIVVCPMMIRRESMVK